MYKTGTILVLKEQREPDEETGQDFPYNRVEVVGPSPVVHSHEVAGSWSGQGGSQGVLIKALTNFGAHLDEPFGKLQKIYDVEFVPEPFTLGKVQDRYLAPEDMGPTPEEVFAQEAPSDPTVPRRNLGPAASPLPDPVTLPGEGGTSILGTVEDDSEEVAAKSNARKRSPLDK